LSCFVVFLLMMTVTHFLSPPVFNKDDFIGARDQPEDPGPGGSWRLISHEVKTLNNVFYFVADTTGFNIFSLGLYLRALERRNHTHHNDIQPNDTQQSITILRIIENKRDTQHNGG